MRCPLKASSSAAGNAKQNGESMFARCVGSQAAEHPRKHRLLAPVDDKQLEGSI